MDPSLKYFLKKVKKTFPSYNFNLICICKDMMQNAISPLISSWKTTPIVNQWTYFPVCVDRFTMPWRTTTWTWWESCCLMAPTPPWQRILAVAFSRWPTATAWSASSLVNVIFLHMKERNWHWVLDFRFLHLSLILARVIDGLQTKPSELGHHM